jgi:hypothetical protein
LGAVAIGANKMKRMKLGYAKSWSCAAVVCCVTLLFGFSAQGSVQDDGTSLMLEMSPPNAGYLNIASGVHSFDRYAEVALKATPKPGYQFVCWLGSVAETANGSTSVFLDSPKMVIAVFERTKFDMAGTEQQGGGDDTAGSSGENRGGGGLIQSRPVDTSSSQALLPAGSSNHNDSNHEYHIPDDLPVPGGEVPEPATITLLAAGFFILAKRQKRV